MNAASLAIKKHEPLVRRLAHQMIGRLPANVEVDDLIQAGLIGLADALTRFDAGQGVMFETYATQRVRGAMLDELRAADWMSRGDRRQQRAIEAAVRRLTQSLGRAPCESEVARAMGLELREYQDAVARVCVTLFINLEDMVTRGDDDERGDYLVAHAAAVDDSVMSNLSDPRVRDLLSTALCSLDEREQRLISMHIDQDMTMLEISRAFGFTESRACQIYNAAKAKLCKRMAFHDVPNWRPNATAKNGISQAVQA